MTERRKLTTAELVAAKPSLEEFRRWPRHPFSILLDDVRSLNNVGLVFRVADAVRAERLYLCGITGYPPLPEGDPRPPWVVDHAAKQIVKTAIRTVEYVPWEYRPDAAALVRELRAAGRQIVVLEQTTASVPYAEAAYRFPLCLVLGHERAGVHDAVLEQADLVVQIPMYGLGNSLNVAMAAAVAAYHLLQCCLRSQAPEPLRPELRDRASGPADGSPDR